MHRKARRNSEQEGAKRTRRIRGLVAPLPFSVNGTRGRENATCRCTDKPGPSDRALAPHQARSRPFVTFVSPS